MSKPVTFYDLDKALGRKAGTFEQGWSKLSPFGDPRRLTLQEIRARDAMRKRLNAKSAKTAKGEIGK